MAIRFLSSETIDGNITVSGTAVVENTLYLAEYIQHTGNSNNNIRFQTNRMQLFANFGTAGYLDLHDNGNVYIGASNATALTITSSSATFAGDVYTTGTSNSNVVISRDNMYLDAGQFYIGADDSVTNDSFRQRTASGSYFIESRKSGTWTNRLQINSAGTLIAGQGATFAGNISGAGATFTGAITATGITTTGSATFGSPLTIKAASPYIKWEKADGTRLAYIQHNETNLIVEADTGIIVLDANTQIYGTLGISSNVNTSGLLTATQIDTNAYLSNGTAADLHGRYLGQAIYGSGTGSGDNYGSVADVFRYKTIAVWRKDSSTNAWSNPSTGNSLIEGNYAHKWSGIDMLPAYSEYVFYFANTLGYSFVSQTVLQHSTNGNSFDCYIERASSTTNPYDTTGWTTMVTKTGISSWPGSTFIQDTWEVGGGYPGLFRIRLVPTWNNSNSINLGSFQAYSSYGNFQHAWSTLFDRSVNFQSKIGVGTNPSRALDVTQTALIQGPGNVNAGTLALGPRSSGSGKWSSITGAHYNQASGSGNGSGSAGIMMIGTYGANGENDVYIGGGLYEVNAATAIRFYTHTTDTSTAGGSPRMTILSNGNVGIGTTSPGNMLDVAGDTDITGQLFVSHDANYVAKFLNTATSMSNNNYALMVDSSSHTSNMTTAGAMSVDVNSGRAFTINGIGRVSIGGNTQSANTLTLTGSATELDIENTSGKRYRFNCDTSGNLRFEDKTGGTEVMRFASSNNVGIGTTSPNYKLDVAGYVGIRNSTSPQLLFFETGSAYTDGMRILRSQDKLHLTYGWNANEEAITIVGGTGSDVGNVGIGNTSPQTTLHVGTTTTVTNQFTNQVAASNFFVNGNANGGASFFQCKTAAVNINMMGNNDFACNQFTFYHKPLSTSQNVVGTITTFSSSTQYNTTSDYRLKENIIPLSDSITRLKQLKPSRFNFIEDPERTMDGFLAHEVQNIVPEAVNGEKDAIDENGNELHQGIDQAKLVPLLVAAIQELEARVKELENK